jgi:hypothetical protein
MPTKPTANSTPRQGRWPVVVMPDALSYFAHDSAWVRLLALLIVKIPAVSVLLFAAYHWLR